jgi:DNA-binding HxlR family transcriptional regulator
MKGLGQNITPKECNSHLQSVGDALYVIGGKWKLRIIISLSEGRKRFNELQRSIGGISARVLSNELKELEMNGFVHRNVHTDATPVIVEYERTDYADSLRDVLGALSAWGKMYRARIKKAAELGHAKSSNTLITQD